ncbi:hypothetical protein V7139_11790 [Neobacillus drentensis]|uniref:hypothetical protein n=1 Tax=Neobacillus drentensis TaxID=220684 RepID=UPI003003379C
MVRSIICLLGQSVDWLFGELKNGFGGIHPSFGGIPNKVGGIKSGFGGIKERIGGNLSQFGGISSEPNIVQSPG